VRYKTCAGGAKVSKYVVKALKNLSTSQVSLVIDKTIIKHI